MHLVQLLLPLYDNDGRAIEREPFARTRDELTDRFGGLTAYTRAPAEGRWQGDSGGGGATRDDLVIYEVMVESLDQEWWGEYRRTLERRFRQEVIVARAIPMRTL